MIFFGSENSTSVLVHLSGRTGGRVAPAKSLSLVCTRCRSMQGTHTVVELQLDALVVREVQLERLVHPADVFLSRTQFPRSVEDAAHLQPLRPCVAHFRVADVVQEDVSSFVSVVFSTSMLARRVRSTQVACSSDETCVAGSPKRLSCSCRGWATRTH